MRINGTLSLTTLEKKKSHLRLPSYCYGGKTLHIKAAKSLSCSDCHGREAQKREREKAFKVGACSFNQTLLTTREKQQSLQLQQRPD